MTTKELLYIEDALGHASYFQTQCAETARQLQNEELKKYIAQVGQKHEEIYSKLFELL